MNRNQHSAYIKEISLSLPRSEEYKHWAIIGHGSVSMSEKQAKEQVIQIIWAPFFEETSKLDFSKSRATKNLIGGLDLYRRRNTWRRGVEPRGRQFSPYISTPLQCSFLTQSAKILSLRNILINKKQNKFVDFAEENEAILTLLESKYIQYEIDSAETPWKVFVPCTEVLRFYYGSSSGLLKAAFKGDEPEKTLYNPLKTKVSEYGLHTVHLRKGVYDIDAPCVARIAFDELARRRFSEIHSLTFTEQMASDNHYPICFPPVLGRLNWKVQGQLLGRDIIVTRITQCSGGFPLEHLIYGRDNDNRGIRTRAPEEFIPIKRKRAVYKGENMIDSESGDGVDSSQDLPRLEDTVSPTIYTDPLILENDDVPVD